MGVRLVFVAIACRYFSLIVARLVWCLVESVGVVALCFRYFQNLF